MPSGLYPHFVLYDVLLQEDLSQPVCRKITKINCWGKQCPVLNGHKVLDNKTPNMLENGRASLLQYFLWLNFAKKVWHLFEILTQVSFTIIFLKFHTIPLCDVNVPILPEWHKCWAPSICFSSFINFIAFGAVAMGWIKPWWAKELCKCSCWFDVWNY